MLRAWLLALVTIAACNGPEPFDAAKLIEREAESRLHPVGSDERLRLLGAAQIFAEVDPATRDVWRGPRDRHASFSFEQHVSCDFLEPRPDLPLPHGTTPKFFCTLRHHHEHALVKVKYGRGNREPVGEMLGSRLLWTLGVATDLDWAVRLRCHHCPRDPWRALRTWPRDAGPTGILELDDAVIQRLHPGVPVEQRQDQGWTFDEVEGLGGDDARRTQLDALVLLAAFIAHGDDKPSNQRLVCPFTAIDAGGNCRAPRLLVADLGSTFGRGASALGLIDGDSRPSFRAWSTLPMWDDAAACRVHWSTRTARVSRVIGEAGRRFLAARLVRLDDGQLHALFTVARVERMGETLRAPDGRVRPVTVDDWVQAFKRRRDEIVRVRCPESR